MGRILMMWALQGCIVGEFHPGNGHSVTETRIVGDFTGVTAAISIPVEVTLDSQSSVQVTCDENLVDLIETEVKDGDLVVQSVNRRHLWVVIDPSVDCRVQITTPSVGRATSTGSGQLTVFGDVLEGLSTVTNTGSGGVEVRGQAVDSPFEVTNTGSGPVLVDSVVAGATHALATGSGRIAIFDGATDVLQVTITGSGGVDAAGLVARDVDALLSGSGSGEVTATDSLAATLTGSGNLVVHGDPEDRDVHETGSGDVHFD